MGNKEETKRIIELNNGDELMGIAQDHCFVITHEMGIISEEVRNVYRKVLARYAESLFKENKRIDSFLDNLGDNLDMIGCHYFWDYEIKGVSIVNNNGKKWDFGTIEINGDLSSAKIKTDDNTWLSVPLKSLAIYYKKRKEMISKRNYNIIFTCAIIFVCLYLIARLIIDFI